MLAYNIVHWFKRLCLPKENQRVNVETIRNELLVLPGKLTCRSGRNLLHLPRDHHQREVFLEAAKRIEQLRLPD
jgi:hypothetical protein